jgi:6-phosphogluconolactonase (cycloisomerase 2 family)
VITRRTFFSHAAGAIAAPLLASTPRDSGKVELYANVGPELLHYNVDVANAALIRKASVRLPSSVQYAWPHVSGRFLYIASSDGYTDPTSTSHHLTAWRIDPQSGDLSMHGEPVHLPARPIHITSDIPSEYLLVAFNNPSSARVYRINRDLTVGSEKPQTGIADPGIYAHQIRVTPGNRHAILVTRGNNATPTRSEDPGALKMFDYRAGLLLKEASIAPNGGYGFGPRHLDFHPSKPWVYVSLERQNKVYVYRLENGRLPADAAFRKDTLSEPNKIGPQQLAGTVHVHPNGRFVYVANRTGGAVDFKGSRVSVEGQNSIAVFSIDQTSGEATLIQLADTRKIHPRTFHIDPGGRLMVAQHNQPMNVREADAVRAVPAGLTVFRIGDDGKLSFERVYDIEVGNETMFWMGMVHTPYR